MEPITILYNPRCSKCREALSLLEDAQCEIRIVEYLKEPPSPQQLKKILQQLGLQAIDIVRKKEPLYLSDYKDKTLTNAAWIKVLAAHPSLIERPIVIDGDKAIIGRPPERVIELLKGNKPY